MRRKSLLPKGYNSFHRSGSGEEAEKQVFFEKWENPKKYQNISL